MLEAVCAGEFCGAVYSRSSGRVDVLRDRGELEFAMVVGGVDLIVPDTEAESIVVPPNLGPCLPACASICRVIRF